VRVPTLCLGTMTFGLQCDEETSFEILDAAFEAGVDFFDTANVYPLGGSVDTVGRTEEIIGRWMKERGVRDRIFEPYYTTKSGGTGLGLAIVKQTVEAHGGHVSLAAVQESGGSTFVMEFPRP